MTPFSPPTLPGKPARASVLLSLLALAFVPPSRAQQPASALVRDTLKNETSSRSAAEQFFYVSQETSTRTGGHRWTERVVELKGGSVRRLIAIDGQPLSPDQARTEDQRIARLVAHPDAFQRAGRDSRSGADMANAMAHAFLFTYDGNDGACTRIRFTPDPAFRPSGYKERILHALEGTISIDERERRVCALHGTVSETVDIGFGVLGKLDKGGQVHLTRSETMGSQWEVTTLSIHLVGKVLLVKGIAQNEDETRGDFRELPAGFTLPQAARLTAEQTRTQAAATP